MTTTNNNFFNTSMVYSVDTLNDQCEILTGLTCVGINGYIWSNHDIYKPFLNNITKILQENGYARNGYKASSMWFTDGRLCMGDDKNINKAYLNISLLNSRYDEIKVTSGNYKGNSEYIKINEGTLKLILEECDKLCDYYKQKMEEALDTPNIDELIETFLGYARKYIDNDRFTVDIEKGKLNYEDSNTEPYNCIVIRYKDTNEYKSSIVFGKDNIGNYILAQRIPLCGESKREFALDNAEEVIKNAVKF